MRLETRRLVLRSWREADYQDLYEYAKSPLVGPQAGWPVHESAEESREIARGFAEEKRDLILALEHKRDAKVIGSIGLHDRQVSLAYEQLMSREMGYVLSPEYWGQGLMPEAAMCVLEYGFYQMGLDMVWCGHFEGNEKSRRVIEKCGMIPMFKRTETFPLIGQKKTVCYYNLTAAEFAARPKVAFHAYTIEQKV